MKSYIAAHVRSPKPGERRSPEEREGALFVTLSRQAGAGALTVSEDLAGILTRRGVGSSRTAWTVFDRNLLREVVERHQLPESYMKDVEERAVPELERIVEEIFGVTPAHHAIVAKTSRTILHLASMGNAVIVGRAASIVTRNLPGGFHARLIGSRDVRCRQLMRFYDIGEEEARRRMVRLDEGRRQYVRKYFKKDIDDSFLYDLVLNTDHLSHKQAARLVAEGVALKHGRSE